MVKKINKEKGNKNNGRLLNVTITKNANFNNKNRSQARREKFKKNLNHNKYNVSRQQRLKQLAKEYSSKLTVKNNKKPNSDLKRSTRKHEEEIDEINAENELFRNETIENNFFNANPDSNELNEGDWNTNNINGKLLSDILFDQMNNVEENGINPKVVEAYRTVGDILKNYTSGKLPKAFNILPSTENWEELIDLTNPMSWSPQAAYEATVMFVSNLNSLLAEKFLAKVLLPAIRFDIRKNGKLNIHYYKALKKSLFKPSGFFKGIIFPIMKNASYKESAIIGSILKKCSIPNNHSSACIMKLIELKAEINLGALYFLKILLLKKYALPTIVKEKLVEYFLSFKNYPHSCPVSWHQTFLILCQIYKFDLTAKEKEDLIYLTSKVKFHHLISEEIERELSYNKTPISFNNNNLNSTMQLD